MDVSLAAGDAHLRLLPGRVGGHGHPRSRWEVSGGTGSHATRRDAHPMGPDETPTPEDRPG